LDAGDITLQQHAIGARLEHERTTAMAASVNAALTKAALFN